MSGQQQFPPMHGVIPYLTIENAMEAVAFYQKAFGAIHHGESALDHNTGKVMNAQLEINGGLIMLSDTFPEHGWGEAASAGKGFTLQLVLADGQAWWDRAIAAGCTPLMPFAPAPWGDIYGQFLDPFGIMWAINQPGPGKTSTQGTD